MSRENEFELSTALDTLIKNRMRAALLVEGVITNYNPENFTCDITILKTPYFEVPIGTLVGSKASFFVIPTDGTQCLVEFKDGNIALPQIVAIDQGDKLLINYRQLVEFNKGLNGGMVKVIELTEVVNELQNTVNNISSLLASHTHSGVTTGPGISGPSATVWPSPITPTQQSYLEDTKVTH